MRPRLRGWRAYVNWIRSNYELRRRTAHIGARPLKVTVDPTNACQLRCALCPTGLHLHDCKTGHASRELFERLLEEIGDYVFFLDFFNWGEPLLHPHVEELIPLAAERGIVCRLSTNLSLPLADERVHRLVTSGLDELIVSLDGASSETYLRYRRQGDFNQVCENMRRIVAEKNRLGRAKPLVTWQFLVFRHNEHEKDRALALAEEIGVDTLAFRAPLVEVERYPLPAADCDPAVWTPSDPLFQIAPTPPPSPAASPKPCAWHYMSSAVNWDGGVAPCCTLYEIGDDFGSLGPHGERSYMDIQNNSVYRAIRDRFAGRRREPANLVCERCPTPSIQNLDRYLNRQIILFTAVALTLAVRRAVGWPP